MEKRVLEGENGRSRKSHMFCSVILRGLAREEVSDGVARDQQQRSVWPPVEVYTEENSRVLEKKKWFFLKKNTNID